MVEEHGAILMCSSIYSWGDAILSLEYVRGMPNGEVVCIP